MIAKFRPCSRRSCAILSIILALLACVSAVSVETDSYVAKPEALDHSEGRPQRGFQANRILRTFVETTEDDVDSEERAITDTMKKIAQAAKDKLTSNNQATTNKLFKKLQVNKETDDKLLQSMPFAEWVTTVTKNFKKKPELAQASMASSLASHFGDEALAKLLVTAKKNYQSRDVAIQLEKAQLQNWASAGKTEDDIFVLLKLNDKRERLFESPVAATWISYVIQLNKQNSDEVIFASLKKMYDDDALVKMIAGAKSSTSTGAMAKKLEQVQLNEWTSEGKSVDDIFEVLKLNKQGKKLLQSPVLSTWVSYVNLQGKNPYDLLFAKLSAQYDDAAIAKMLVAAKQDDETSSIALKLEEVQFQNWQEYGDSADDVFNLLKLNMERGDILKSPILTTWISYTTKLDENPYELLLVQLMKRYDDEGLTRMLLNTKGSYKIRTIAEKLAELQLKQWKQAGKSSDDVYNLLKLNRQSYDILNSMMLKTWISYTMKLDEDPYQFLLVKLMKRYDDDEILTKMIVNAKGSYTTESIGTKLGEVQWKNWLSTGKTADDVFLGLRLNNEGNKLFTSSVWSVWVSYLTRLNRENPDELMFTVLKTHYGDEGMAKMITLANKDASTKGIGRTLEEELWRSQGKDGADIFKLLKLDKEGNNFLESPVLSTWISYVTKLNTLDKKTPDAISQLQKLFRGDLELARIIGFAKQNARTAASKKVITELQDLQFKKWLADGATPGSLSTRTVRDGFEVRDTKVTLDFTDYYNLNAASTS